jgi:putative PIN family toxin of toxin-antitoxin system
VVLDTNVYVSRFLRPHSIPGKAVAKAWIEAQPLISMATWRELLEVLSRPKFAPYIQAESIRPFVLQVFEISERVPISSPIRACRDPRDDKFLEVAVHGRADVLVTGDKDLLALHPFQGVSILSPADFLER